MAADADAADEQTPGEGDLLASFPNLRALEPLCPEAEWGTFDLPKLPENVTTGVLSNGLTYFVQENKEPKDRAELYLVVGFGSLVEEEAERGIAHIIEHLSFSATKAYENHGIVKFLESIGAPFGACQNAYTSFDRTVYTLHVPTDKEGILMESLTVLREFAYFTRISEEDLEKERKVVIQEWRESRNAQGRLAEQYINELCKNSRWCERLPIGKEHVINGVEAKTLREFYARFYHPARMAVIAVGDFDGGVVEKTIAELFDIAPEAIEPLPRAAVPPQRPHYPVPDTAGVAVASSTDSELSFAQGILDCKRPKQVYKRIAGYRKRMTEQLFHRTLSSRLLKLILEPKGPRNFFMVSTESGEPVPSLNPMSIQIAPLPGRFRHALASIVREIERVKRMGFHSAEVLRAQRSTLAEHEEEYIEREQKPSESFAEAYVRLFLDDQAALGIKQRAQVAKAVVPSISCEEVSRIADLFDFKQNVVLKVATPPMSIRNPLYSCWSFLQTFWNMTCPRRRLDLPNSDEILALIEAVEKEELDAWPEDEDDVDTRLKRGFEACKAKRLPVPEESPQLQSILAPGVPKPQRGASLAFPVDPAAQSQDFPPIGEEVVLQNGLRLFLKDTDLFDDQILLGARRWGGLSEHSVDGMLGKGVVTTEAQVCSMAAMMLGICGFSVESMQECLEGKRLEPSPPEMDAYWTSFDASCSPADLEDLLLLTNLLFMRPVEPKATSRGRLALVKLGLLAWRLGENRDPQAQFRKRVQKCIHCDHPYTRQPSIWSILMLNFQKASAIFNERASRPCEWTFALVGRLPEKSILLPLLQQYLGSIPNEGPAASSQRPEERQAREAITPLELKFPSKSVREEVRLKMVEPKGSTVIAFPVELSTCTAYGKPESAEAEFVELHQFRLLVKMLNTRLVEVLRFERGQIYGVSVSDDMTLSPPQPGRIRRGTLSVRFECDPAEADELVEVTQAELGRLRDGTAAFTEDNVKAALEQDRRDFEEAFQTNSWWAGTVLDLYFSRAQGITGDIGATAALWWRARGQATSTFGVEVAMKALRTVLPDGGASAVVTMRPKGKLPKSENSVADTAAPANVADKKQN